jgi:hypothetical protein
MTVVVVTATAEQILRKAILTQLYDFRWLFSQLLTLATFLLCAVGTAAHWSRFRTLCQHQRGSMRWSTLALVGALDAVYSISMCVAVSVVPGTLTVLIPQLLLPLTLFTSALFSWCRHQPSHGGGGGGGGGRPGPGPGPGPRPVGVVDRELVSSHEQADGPFAHGLPLDYGGGGRRRTAAAGRGAGGHHRLRRPPATDHSLAVLTDSTTTHTKHMEDIDDAPGLHSSIHIHDGGGVTTMTTMMAAVPPRSGAHASASTSPRAAAGAISMGGSGPWGGPQRERRRRRRRQQQQQQQPSALGARRLPSPQVTMEARAPAVLTDCLADWLAGMTGMTGMRRRLPPRQHRVACHG